MTSGPVGRWRIGLGPALSVVTLGALLVWSWGRWPDVLVDFGRELYVPWRLREGEHLYADIAYFNGPLSPWLNAILFRVFGVSLRTLVIANTVVLVCVGVMIHLLLRVFGDRLTATAGSLVFLTMFAFGQFVYRGNYSFVAPYSHEATHGITLCAAALLLLWSHLRRGGSWSLLGVGLALGAVFLTKAEFVLALGPAVAVGLLAHHGARGLARREATRLAGVFLVGTLVFPAAALGLLLADLPPGVALRGVLGSWVYLFVEDLGQLKFYRDIMGTSDLPGSLTRIGAWSLRYLLVLAPAAAVAFGLRRMKSGRGWAVVAMAPLAAGAVLIGREITDWQHLPSAFPVVLLAALCLGIVGIVGRRADPEQHARRVFALACLTFALALLAKMIFNVRMVHYGFVLALPATLAIVVILLEAVPERIEQRGGHGPAFRSATLGILAALMFVQLQTTQSWLSRRTVEIGSRSDAFLADDRDRPFAILLDRMEQRMQPGETLLVVPEGVMLNYLTRRPNPIPFVNFMPPELIMFGEDRIVKALEAHPPSWVVYVNRGVREYGYRLMGQDYGLAVMSWIQTHYLPVERVLHEGHGDPRSSYALILRHMPGAPPGQERP